MMDRAVHEAQPTKAQMRKRLGEVANAAALLQHALQDAPIREFLELEGRVQIENIGGLDHVLRTISERATLAAKSPRIGKPCQRLRHLCIHGLAALGCHVADAILDCTERDDIVLDPYLGSGTTVLAAERTNRRCYGIETEPRYVDTAIIRWQNLTGKAARNLSGETFAEIKAARENAP